MFEVFWDDKDGYLKFQICEGNVFAHAEIFNWSPTIYRKAQAIWEVAKEELAEEGFSTIFVLIPADNIKLIKFEKMFGFQPIQINENVMCMACSTEVSNGT